MAKIEKGPVVDTPDAMIYSKELSLNMSSVSRFITGWETQNDIKSLFRCVERDILSVGFDGFGFRFIPVIGSPGYIEDGHFFIPRSKRDQARRHREFIEKNAKSFSNYADMPIERYIHDKSRAVWLRDLFEIEEFKSPTSQAYLELVQSDCTNAICVPAFGPGGARGSFVFFCASVETRPDKSVMILTEYLASQVLFKFLKLIKATNDELLKRITPREEDILNWLPHGLSNKEIARKLNISPNTVDGYLKTIFIKLGVQDRMGATMRWLAVR